MIFSKHAQYPAIRLASRLARLVHARRPAAAAIALVAALALLAACTPDAATGPLPLGPWGGLQGTLMLYPDSATLDLPCAVGRIPAGLMPSADGSFDLAGSYAIQAGPVSIDGPAWRSASYAGWRHGDRIQLYISVPDAARIGPFTFERGVVRMFPRCL